jgi:hypothetical protein
MQLASNAQMTVMNAMKMVSAWFVEKVTMWMKTQTAQLAQMSAKTVLNQDAIPVKNSSG